MEIDFSFSIHPLLLLWILLLVIYGRRVAAYILRRAMRYRGKRDDDQLG